jgi:hypothetical protein
MFVCCVSICISAPQTVLRKAVLREGPGSFYPVVIKLNKGELVDVAEPRGGWLKVKYQHKKGWLPKSSFQGVRKGLDYAGLLNSEKSVVISSVDIAAATKGAFEAKYSEDYKSNFVLVDRLDVLRIDPMQVSSMLNSLTVGNSSVLRILPHQNYENNIIVQQDAEILLGRAMAATLVTPGFIDNTEVIEYVNAVAAVIGMKTSRYELPFRVAIIDDESIGGFGLPGGYIVITKGLLAEVHTEAELACLLAHEMAHVCLFHGLREFNKRGTHRKSDSAFAELNATIGEDGDDPFAELNALTGDTTSPGIEDDLNRLANTSYLKIIGKRAREDELEADLFGAAYAAAAGYDPRALVTYLERVSIKAGIHDSFRHHPSIDDRISALQSGMQRFRLVQRWQSLKEVRFKEKMASFNHAAVAR